jgi:hypothetical protein
MNKTGKENKLIVVALNKLTELQAQITEDTSTKELEL